MRGDDEPLTVGQMRRLLDEQAWRVARRSFAVFSILGPLAVLFCLFIIATFGASLLGGLY